MTDNEIIKALECYRGQKLFAFNGKKPEIYIHDILDLIGRQKAEIERLKVLDGWHDSAVRRCKEVEEKLRTAKSEAYKEFAEEVNKELFGEEYQLDKAHRRAVERVLNRLTSKE